MPGTPLRYLAPLTLLCLLSTSDSANAEPSATDRAMAETLFRDAKALMAEKKFATACLKLAESLKLDPKPGTLLNLAVCHEEEGKTATAWGEYLEAAAQNTAAKRVDRAKFARERAEQVEKKLSRLTIEVTTQIRGLEVSLDDKPLGQGSFGSAFPVDPGEHQIRAEAPGKQAWSSVASVPPGPAQTRVLVPELLPLPAAAPSASAAPQASAPQAPGSSAAPPPPAPPPPPPASAPPPPTEPSGEGSGRRTAGIVLTGAGALFTVAGGYFGLRTFSKKQAGDDRCAGKFCDDEGLALQDEAHTSATFSTVGFALGAVGLGAGVYLLLTSPDRAAASSRTVRLGASASRSGPGVSLQGSW